MSGNAISNAKPIKKQDYQLLVSTLKTILPNELHLYPFGSAGKKDISGDVDFFISAVELLSLFPSHRDGSLLESRKLLQEFFISNGLQSTRTGVSVHVGIPLYDDIIQVDLTVIYNPEQISHLHDHVYESDTVKGKTIVSIWCDLANLTSDNLMISPYAGLLYRDTRELISNDPDVIAKIIISPTATAYDMRSPSRLLNSIKNNPIKFTHIQQTYFQ